MESTPSNDPPTTTKVDAMKRTRRPQNNWVLMRLSLDSTPKKLIKIPGAFNCAEFLQQENTQVEFASLKVPNEKATNYSSTEGFSGFPPITAAQKKIPKGSLELASDSIVNETGSSNSISEGSLSNIQVTPRNTPSNCPSSSNKDDLMESTQIRKDDLIGRTRTKKYDLMKRKLIPWMAVTLPPYNASGKLFAEIRRQKRLTTRNGIAENGSTAGFCNYPPIIIALKRSSEKSLKSVSDNVVNKTVSSNSILEGSISSNTQSTPDLRSTKKRKYPRHFDDFCEEHVQTPKGATRALKVGKKRVAKLQKKLDSLKSKNLELKKRVKALEQAVGEQKNPNQ